MECAWNWSRDVRVKKPEVERKKDTARQSSNCQNVYRLCQNVNRLLINLRPATMASLTESCRTTLAAIAAALGPSPADDPAATERVASLIHKYEQRYQQEMRSATKRAGLNMSLPKEVLGGESAVVFGHAPGVKPGDKFKDRGQLYVAGVHATLMKGIHAPPAKHPDFERGAYSVVMSGGYADDEDMGECFWYTGEGGMDTKSKRQVKDQVLGRGANAALRNNCDSCTPVRVIRGFVTGGPTDGDAAAAAASAGEADRKPAAGVKKERGYVYEGLYAVLQYKQEPSKDGPMVCKFLMYGVPGHSAVHAKVEFGIFGSMSAGCRLQSRKLAASPEGIPSKRPRIDKSLKALQATRATMLAAIQKRYEGKGVLQKADLSDGAEPVPIPLVNEVNEETLPDTFRYIREYSWAPGVYQLVAPVLRFADEEMFQFTCATENGTCGLAFNRHIRRRDMELQATGRLPLEYEPHMEEQYNAAGCLMVTDPCGIHECGPLCTSAKCRNNRQLTNGVTLPLEVFMTPAKGWGVRCREAIPAGSFVCTYVGELVTDAMAEVRKGVDHYLFDLDFFAHIYTEIAQKGLDAISQEIPIHKIPPVLSMGFVRQLQMSAAKAIRQSSGRPDRVEAGPGPSSSLSFQRPTGAGAAGGGGGEGTLQYVSSSVGPDGLMQRDAVQVAAAELLQTCRRMAAEGSAEPSGDARGAGCGGGGSGGGPGTSAGVASASGRPLDGPPTPTRYQEERTLGLAEAVPGSLVEAAVTAAAATKGAALEVTVAEAARRAAEDPGAFYLQPIFSREDGVGLHPSWSAEAAGLGASERVLESGVSMASGVGDEEEYAPILVIDARDRGNVGRFINHSCDGNLTIQAVLAGAYRSTLVYHVGLFACKDIPALEELTYNYGYHIQAGRSGGQYGMVCHCGAPNCVGQLM